MPADAGTVELRAAMVETQIAARGVRSPAVLAAMRRVPREYFVPEGLRDAAYDDTPLSIGERQTISQPYIVALMLAAMELRPTDRVLEIGTGSGYSAALLGELAAEVHTVERIGSLARTAADRLQRAGCRNVHVHRGDGTRGHGVAAPYDAIAVAAGGPVVPRALRRQLAPGGRLVIPVGPAGDQRLLRIVRTGAHEFTSETLTAVRFVPLIGADGWAG